MSETPEYLKNIRPCCANTAAKTLEHIHRYGLRTTTDKVLDDLKIARAYADGQIAAYKKFRATISAELAAKLAEEIGIVQPVMTEHPTIVNNEGQS